jgi:HSP20 family protein
MAEMTKRKQDTGLAWPGSMRFHDEVDRLFNRFFGELSPMEVVGSSVVDIREDEKNVYIDAELPGVKRDDTELTIENGILYISAEKKFEQEQKQGREDLRERYYGRIYRALTLPSSVNPENVKATMKDGVLHITLEKQAQAQPRKIEIQEIA